MISCESADVEKQEFPFRNYFVPLPALRPRGGSIIVLLLPPAGGGSHITPATYGHVNHEIFLIEIMSLTSQCLSLNFVFNI